MQRHEKRQVWKDHTSRMKIALVTILTAFVVVSCAARQQTSVVEKASSLEERGAFREAAGVLTQGLAGDSARIDASYRKTLAFELERLRRIRLDYTLGRADLLRQLQRSIPDLTTAEFDRWFDERTIDDTLRFLQSSRRNLFWRYPGLNARRGGLQDSALEQSVLEMTRSITAAASHDANPYVLPKRFKMQMSVTVEENAAPAGDTIRAWLPVPRRYPYQRDLQILSASSPIREIADEDSPIRSVYMEEVAVKDQPTEFNISYEYTTYGVRFLLEPNRVEPLASGDTAVQGYLEQAPHILFTERIKALSRRLVGPSTVNPLTIARKIYRWVADSIQYSHAPEYSTIRNISDNCLLNRYGDCGQEALLFMTLCRYNGIPARWQSGWLTIPGDLTIHDWAEIYVQPYGWIPVDPYMGIWARQYTTTLTPEQREFVRDFYFGGLDQYRMAANSDHCQQLTPTKRSMRSDTVDFQRGELEFDSTNIYFNKFTYDLTPEELHPHE
jgi:transglutaminase-like putative cysteine protease